MLTIEKTRHFFWGWISVHEIIEKYQFLKNESSFPRRYNAFSVVMELIIHPKILPKFRNEKYIDINILHGFICDKENNFIKIDFLKT